MDRSTTGIPAPLDDARRSPIDQIDRATTALIVRRILRPDRSEVTPFGSAI